MAPSIPNLDAEQTAELARLYAGTRAKTAKRASGYIAQPTEDKHDAWAVWTKARGEYILCGRPRALTAMGITVLCTVSERLLQIAGRVRGISLKEGGGS